MIITQSIRQYISRLKADSRTAWIAFSWICFMFFFTYTDLLVALVSNDIAFASKFQELHIRSISLFVNFGLIIMLLFDYSAKNKNIHRAIVWAIVAGLVLSLSIYIHCCKAAIKAHSELIFPLNLDNFSIGLFVFLMILVFILKTFVEFSVPVTVSEGPGKNQ